MHPQCIGLPWLRDRNSNTEKGDRLIESRGHFYFGLTLESRGRIVFTTVSFDSRFQIPDNTHSGQLFSKSGDPNQELLLFWDLES
jgi:hypothetical protein